MAAYALLPGFAVPRYCLQPDAAQDGLPPTRPSCHWGEQLQGPLHCQVRCFDTVPVFSPYKMRPMFEIRGWLL